MRYLLYYRNIYGTLVFSYSDDDGKQIRENYIGYSLDEALRRFREKHALKRKHIEIASLDDGKLSPDEIRAELEYRKYMRTGKSENFIDVFVYDFLLQMPQEMILRYLLSSAVKSIYFAFASAGRIYIFAQRKNLI